MKLLVKFNLVFLLVFLVGLGASTFIARGLLRQVFATRWRRLAAEPEFRAGLVAGLKSHPEWTTVLNPPAHASQSTH